MASKFQDLMTKGLLNTPPKHLKNNIQYEVITGSTAYGVAQDDSDRDVVGWGIPSKDVLFPHTAGYIQGFSKNIPAFEQFQQHHIMDKGARQGQGIEYDMTIYSIVKYFRLAMDNNPNMTDTLFVPENCVLHCTDVGRMVRDARRTFLHKGSYQKLRGYAISQKSKMTSKNLKKLIETEEYYDIEDWMAKELYEIYAEEGYKAVEERLQVQYGYGVFESETYSKVLKSCGQLSKRRDSVKKYGCDVKYMYHLVRLMEQCDQVLNTCDLNLQRDAELLKGIRRGEWSVERALSYFEEKEKQLEQDLTTSKLPYGPPEEALRALLMDCLEHHYGNLEDAVTELKTSEKALQEIIATINKYRIGV